MSHTAGLLLHVHFPSIMIVKKSEGVLFLLIRHSKYSAIYSYRLLFIFLELSSTLAKAIQTGEFLPTEEDSIDLNFSKEIKSNDIRAMHEFLGKSVEIRVIENKIIVSNEPKPVIDHTKGNLMKG